ncbi:phage portal protein [Streptomyces bohaiensis]|uniref:Phage portal protein n=1 Tax=Streptomyces bohaiensis TaxID=1431344 RepID=A0ABX1C8F4_9ACTN|nr:phage portal protein [Streptomyces bohaiensis]NJQ14218.1 phage portal protein [Streptomyces bohaiensis]
MPWWRRSKAPASGGQVIDQDGVLVPVKGQQADDLASLGAYVAQHGLRVVDPGVPLAQYTDTAAAMDVWRTQPSVRKVVDYIARAISTIPWHVYERVSDTDRRRVTDHPLAQLLAAPGPGLGPARLWHSLIVDWLIHDRWCAAVLPSADTGSGWELRRKPARRMHVLADDDDRPVALYLVRSTGPADVVDLPAPFLWDSGYAAVGADGTSPMDTLRHVLAEQAEAVAWRRQVWQSGARVPTVIERPVDAGAWSAAAKARFATAFSAFMGRGGQAGGTPILEEGMKLVKIDSFSPTEARDVEGRQLSDAEVASAYHIAPELVGARQGNYSNVDAFRQMLYTHALGPYITQLEGVLNALLVPMLAPGSSLYVEAHVEAKLRGSFLEQASLLQTAVGAPYMLRSEARARQNLPAVDGTDELVTPLNVLVGGLASPRDTAPPPKTGRPLVKSASRPDDLGDADSETEALETRLALWAQGQADRLLTAADAAKDSGPPDFYALWAAQSPERQAQLAAILAAHGLRLAQVGAWSVLGLWNPEADGWDPAAMEAWLAAAAETHAEQYEQAGYEACTEAVRAEGDWRENLATGMAAWVSAAATRAITAATEAKSFGQQDAARVSGLTYKKWVTKGLNPRPSHRALSGSRVPLDDTFANGLRWPADIRGPADETARCKCDMTFSREE